MNGAGYPAAMPIVFLLMSLGCSDPPLPPPPDLSSLPTVQHDCALRECSTAAELEVCAAERCPMVSESWAVNPLQVRYSRDSGVLFVEVAVEYTAVLVDGAPQPHPSEVWLGVTVLTVSGEDIDLAVQTVFPDQIGEPFTFSADVGGDVQDIIFGLWGERVEPCDIDRSGCRNFGFVLDQSLAAWPVDTYVEQPPRRQRILESAPTMLIESAGAPHETLAAARPRADQALQAELERFGLTAAPAMLGIAPSALPLGLQVVHRDPRDGPLASTLAATLGSSSVALDVEAAADFVVQIGGSEETMACLRERCAGQSGAILEECMSGCP